MAGGCVVGGQTAGEAAVRGSVYVCGKVVWVFLFSEVDMGIFLISCGVGKSGLGAGPVMTGNGNGDVEVGVSSDWGENL